MEGAAAVVDLDVRMWCCSFNIGASECGDWCVVHTRWSTDANGLSPS